MNPRGESMKPFPQLRSAAFSLLACLVIAGSLLRAGHQNAYPLPEERGTAGILNAIAKLPVFVRVLHTTAHPDDENAATLTWLARKMHARTALFSLTRGEGGQNVLGTKSTRPWDSFVPESFWKLARSTALKRTSLPHSISDSPRPRTKPCGSGGMTPHWKKWSASYAPGSRRLWFRNGRELPPTAMDIISRPDC